MASRDQSTAASRDVGNEVCSPAAPDLDATHVNRPSHRTFPGSGPGWSRLPWLAVAFHGPAFSPDNGEMPTLDVLAAVAFSPSSEIYRKLFVAERIKRTLSMADRSDAERKRLLLSPAPSA